MGGTFARRSAMRVCQPGPVAFQRAITWGGRPYLLAVGGTNYLNHYQPEDHMHIQHTIAALPKHLHWMVSYDNHPEISKLYRKFDQLSYSLNYTAQARYRGLEIIMFSRNLTPPAPVRPMQHTQFTSARRVA